MASVGSMMIPVRARPVRDALTPPQHAKELCPSPRANWRLNVTYVKGGMKV